MKKWLIRKDGIRQRYNVSPRNIKKYLYSRSRKAITKIIKPLTEKKGKNYIVKVFARVDTTGHYPGRMNVSAEYFKVFKTKKEAEANAGKMRDDLEHMVNKQFNNVNVNISGIEIEETDKPLLYSHIEGKYCFGKGKERTFTEGTISKLKIYEKEKTITGTLKEWLNYGKNKN